MPDIVNESIIWIEKVVGLLHVATQTHLPANPRHVEGLTRALLDSVPDLDELRAVGMRQEPTSDNPDDLGASEAALIHAAGQIVAAMGPTKGNLNSLVSDAFSALVSGMADALDIHPSDPTEEL